MASFEKLNYGLRPSKQVERRLIIEILQGLAPSGFDFSKYKYVGLGSIYFADFILFHKQLHISEMLCAEREPIPNRMIFNCPYNFIELHDGPVSDKLPGLARDRPHLVWLDYDWQLHPDMLGDITMACQVLAPGSLLFITVKAEQELPPILARRTPHDELPSTFLKYVQDVFRAYIPSTTALRDVSRSEIPGLYGSIMLKRIREAMTSVGPKDFLQLVNCKYSDGAQMLTFGGMIADGPIVAQVRMSSVAAQLGYNAGQSPTKISVPPLTVREKLWMDQQIPGLVNVNPSVFEIEDALVENYVKFYKQYPLYSEMLL